MAAGGEQIQSAHARDVSLGAIIVAHCKKNSDVKRRISYCDPPNLQYKTHPEFWPSHSRIFKTSLYYKSRLILKTRRYIDTLDSRFIFYIDRLIGNTRDHVVLIKILTVFATP